VFIHGQHDSLLFTPMGYWYLVEILGFVLIPCVLFVRAVRNGNPSLCRIAAVLTLVGIVMNRLNIAVIAFKWNAPVRYFPTWMEIEVTLAVIFAEILVFRWIVNRMPVLSNPPAWASEKSSRGPAESHTTPLHEQEPLVKEA